nr:hypothetical protein [Tanacetum cinerariifolium]
MPIPKVLLSSELKESHVYVTYVDKYPQAQVAPKYGIGKRFMKKSMQSKSSLKDMRTKKRKEEQKSTCWNCARKTCQQKGTAPESPDNSSSFEDSSESTNDDKTESERELENEVGDVDTDSEQGDKSDKSSFDEETDKYSDNGIADVSMYLNEPPEIQMTGLLYEPVYNEATTIMVAPILETIHEEEEQVTSTPPATPPTKTKAKQARTLLKRQSRRKNDWKKVVTQRLANMEQKTYDDIIEESIQENGLNAVKN